MKKVIYKVLFFAALLALYMQLDAPTPGKALIGDEINAPKQWKDAQQSEFVIATYNIRRSKGNDGERDISRSAAVLKQAQADIVGLNELSGTLFYGSKDQAEQMAQLLDTGWLFAPTDDRWYQHYFGNGLLSRFPVSEWQVHPLYAGVKETRSLRNMIIANIPINGRELHVLVTHLDRGNIREQQLTQVLNRFRQLPEPAVILGDFNSEIDNQQLQEFLSDPHYTDAVKIAMGKQLERIDWIISKGLEVKSGGMQERGISDHPAFWVRFAFPGNSDMAESGDMTGSSDMAE